MREKKRHPISVLKQDFIKVSGMSIEEVASRIDVKTRVLEGMLSSKRGLRLLEGIKLARLFNLPDGYFLQLQTKYLVDVVRKKEAGAIEKVIPLGTVAERKTIIRRSVSTLGKKE